MEIKRDLLKYYAGNKISKQSHFISALGQAVIDTFVNKKIIFEMKISIYTPDFGYQTLIFSSVEIRNHLSHRINPKNVICKICQEKYK